MAETTSESQQPRAVLAKAQQEHKERELAVWAHHLAHDLRRAPEGEPHLPISDRAADVKSLEQLALRKLDAVHDWYIKTVVYTPPWDTVVTPPNLGELAKLAAMPTAEFDRTIRDYDRAGESDAIRAVAEQSVGRHQLPSLVRSHRAEARAWRAIVAAV